MQTFLTVCILVITIIVFFRLNKSDKYNKWSGGVFLIMGDDSLIPLKFEDADIDNDVVIKGIYIAGAKRETMPFVDYFITDKNKDGSKAKRVLMGRYIHEEENGVRIIFAESFRRDKYGTVFLEIRANHAWTGDSSYPYSVATFL